MGWGTAGVSETSTKECHLEFRVKVSKMGVRKIAKGRTWVIHRGRGNAMRKERCS